MRTKALAFLFSAIFVQFSFANVALELVSFITADSTAAKIELPKGTILFLKSTKDVYAKNYKAGDHFFIELNKDVTSKGEVIIPKETIVQMNVLESVDNKRSGSTFTVTVGGFIIDNILQEVTTEAKKVMTEGKAKGTLARAAIGAGIGAAFDGGSGAGKGAAIGGATGLLRPGQTIYFPKGTETDFQLAAPLVVDWR